MKVIIQKNLAHARAPKVAKSATSELSNVPMIIGQKERLNSHQTWLACGASVQRIWYVCQTSPAGSS